MAGAAGTDAGFFQAYNKRKSAKEQNMAWRQLLREKGAADAQGSPPPRAKGKGKAKGKASGRDARDAEIARRFGFKP